MFECGGVIINISILYCDLTNQWLEVSGSNCGSMSGQPDSLLWCDIISVWSNGLRPVTSPLILSTRKNTGSFIKINLSWKIYSEGGEGKAFWLFIYRRRKRDISLSFSSGRVSPQLQLVSTRLSNLTSDPETCQAARQEMVLPDLSTFLEAWKCEILGQYFTLAVRASNLVWSVTSQLIGVALIQFKLNQLSS